MRTLRSIDVVAAIAAACLAAGCTAAQGTEPKPARPVRIEAATMTPPQADIRYSATVESFQQVALAFKTSGYVEDVVQRQGADGRLRAAQPGDRVTKGTVLARVHEADYRERVNQGRARLAEGEAALKKARLDLERAGTLFAADSLTKPELDAAQASFEAAEARVIAAQADIELASIALRDCALAAPADGILLERGIEVGSLAGAGTVAFVLGDISAVKARFGIPDSMIESVKLGERIGVTIDAVAGATFPGRVIALAPAADPQSRVFDVEVTIPNQDGRLRPGMIGTVALGRAAGGPAAVSQPSLTIPLTAVVKSADAGGTYSVLVAERDGDLDVARMRRVELGELMGNGVAVVNGVAPGDRVVVTGASLLADGDAVHVIP